MLTVRSAYAPVTLSPSVCPPEREDEPDFREYICDALTVAGFVPIRGFATAVDGPFVRVALTDGPALTERVLLAWAALGAFDAALLDERTILVGWPGELAIDEAA